MSDDFKKTNSLDNRPRLKLFRENYDYGGENYDGETHLDRIERRLRNLSKTLKRKKHHEEAKELNKMIKSVRPKGRS